VYIFTEIYEEEREKTEKKNAITTWEVENIILTFPHNLEFMFLGHFSFVL
jgi:hypothetical protein